MSRPDGGGGARRRSRTRLLVVTAALTCVLAAAWSATLFTTSARAAQSPAPASTFLPEMALSSDAPRLAGGESPLLSGLGAVASKPGSGGWFWPTGSEDFSSYAGFLAPRGAYVHVAQDMRSAKGRPVYAIAAGTVWISRADAGGYGVGGAPGGCMIIVHRTAAGEEFRALYGHVSGLKYKAGAHVAAGAVIASINGCAHLHFGIHPSTVYRDGNPYAGHVPKSWKDHGGFVDPVDYLKTNPRAVTYDPPRLPVVRITTDSAPGHGGAAAGIAYWDEQAAGGAVTYAYDLFAGTRRQLGPGEAVPTFDDLRYAVRPLVAPALGISVRDRQPLLAAEARPVRPAWRASARLSTTLTNAAARPFAGARIVLERLRGTAWTRVAAGRTDDAGHAAFAYTPLRRTVLRVQFLLPVIQPAAATYVPVEGAVVTVVPRVRLSVPALPTTVARGRASTVGGSVAPRHAVGKGAVHLEFQRLTLEGSWVAAFTRDVELRDGAGTSLYSRVVKLRDAGAWRVRAVHPEDAAHAATVSRWRTFAVK